MAYVSNRANIYEDNKTREIKVGNATDVRVQAIGAGEYKIVGKLTPDAEFKPISMVNLSDFSTATKIVNNDIYAGDVSGLYSISADNVTGFSKIHACLMG